MLCDDEREHPWRDDLPMVLAQALEFFEANPDVTGAQLFDRSCS